jgi:hypothetical protein
MTYRGDAGGGYAGHHLTVAALEALRPAADNAGRVATVGTPGVTAAYYMSAGGGWTAIGKATVSNTRNKFFASLPQGANFRSQKSLAAIPAWASGVLVQAGYVCSNAGGLYFLLGTLSTSAAIPVGGVTTVTAPTGTGSAVIQTATDLLQWLYMGAYTTDVLSPDLSDTPAFSFGTIPAANTRRYNTQVAADLNAMYLTGSDYINAAGSGGGYNGVAAVTYPNSFSVDFVTDAPNLILNVIQNGGAQSISPTVNGWPLWNKCGIGYTWAASGTNNNSGYIFDWSGKPNKVRRVRLPISNQTFTGVWIDPRYSIWQPLNPNRYRLYLEGDSITQGGQPSNGAYRSGHRLANMLGCDDVWDSATGSTGFINSGGGSTLITRIPRVIAAAPDILYVRPIYNDVGNSGQYTPASRQAVYKQYFDTLLASLPNLIIICGGGHGNGASNLTTDAASPYQVEQDMATAIANYNHPHVKFLPTISDASGVRWLNGDGHAGTTANTTHGNSDFMVGDGFDQLHPNVRYYETFMQREFNGIVGIMNNLTD